ncbi:WXG100 family type VII secretion target [Nocardia aurantia]|uniref:WXG100 family type VII secretion target n=1 Tax=Nocardia aurantia TaxID=2585199 RepID=A0A7K0DIG1_9NOCA|nr:hypothetical protein [Nocardia aurantia]MQY25467.1 hypothetical protein [Nocardia aurantia]
MADTFAVDPAELAAQAPIYRGAGAELSAALSRLSSVLATEGRCWGSDDPGRQFARTYEPDVDATIRNVENLALILRQTGNDLAGAADSFDRHDDIGGRLVSNRGGHLAGTTTPSGTAPVFPAAPIFPAAQSSPTASGPAAARVTATPDASSQAAPPGYPGAAQPARPGVNGGPRGAQYPATGITAPQPGGAGFRAPAGPPLGASTTGSPEPVEPYADSALARDVPANSIGQEQNSSSVDAVSAGTVPGVGNSPTTGTSADGGLDPAVAAAIGAAAAAGSPVPGAPDPEHGPMPRSPWTRPRPGRRKDKDEQRTKQPKPGAPEKPAEAVDPDPATEPVVRVVAARPDGRRGGGTPWSSPKRTGPDPAERTTGEG